MSVPSYPLPAPFLAICREEVVRSSLTSLPRKLDFAKERGMTLEQVHQWMVDTRNAFEIAVRAAVPAELVVVAKPRDVI